jgi:hypothetical protein
MGEADGGCTGRVPMAHPIRGDVADGEELMILQAQRISIGWCVTASPLRASIKPTADGGSGHKGVQIQAVMRSILPRRCAAYPHTIFLQLKEHAANVLLTVNADQKTLQPDCPTHLRPEIHATASRGL